MTYTYCKKVITNGNYGTKEDMMIKLDVFILNNRINQDQYNELVSLLNAAAQAVFFITKNLKGDGLWLTLQYWGVGQGHY